MGHAPGSMTRVDMAFRAYCLMAESVRILSQGALSKTMLVRQRGGRAVPNRRQSHPGEIVLLLLIRKNLQNRKV